MGPAIPKEEMLKVASLVFYNKDKEEKEHTLEKERNKEKREAQLLATLQGQRPMVWWNEEPKALIRTIAINSGSPDTRKGNALEIGLLEDCASSSAIGRGTIPKPGEILDQNLSIRWPWTEKALCSSQLLLRTSSVEKWSQE